MITILSLVALYIFARAVGALYAVWHSLPRCNEDLVLF